MSVRTGVQRAGLLRRPKQSLTVSHAVVVYKGFSRRTARVLVHTLARDLSNLVNKIRGNMNSHLSSCCSSPFLPVSGGHLGFFRRMSSMSHLWRTSQNYYCRRDFHSEPRLHMHHTLAFISAICTKYRPCYWIWISAPSHIRRPLKYIKMKQSHLITPKLIKEEQIGN